MAIELELTNIMKFLTAASPIFISLFFIMETAFNASFRGIIWGFGILLTQILAMLLRAAPFMKNFGKREYLKYKPNRAPNDNERMPDLCSIFDDPFYPEYAAPSTHGVFHAFTLMYIILGVSRNPTPQGISFIITLSLIAATDFGFRVFRKCEKWTHFLMGAVIGAVAGWGWFTAVNATDPKLTYFGPEDNMKKCRMGKQKFKCQYKKI